MFQRFLRGRGRNRPKLTKCPSPRNCFLWTADDSSSTVPVETLCRSRLDGRATIFAISLTLTRLRWTRAASIIRSPDTVTGVHLNVIRCCLFDMGNVLVHFSHKRMCEQLGRLVGQHATDIERILLESGLQWDFERGQCSEDEFRTRFLQAADVEPDRHVSLDELKHAASDIFWLNEPIVPVIDRLKDAGMRLVVFSNTSVSHFQFIQQHFDVLDRFDDFALSYQAGSLKPDAEFYDVAAKKAGASPNECFTRTTARKTSTRAAPPVFDRNCLSTLINCSTTCNGTE